MSPFGAAAAEGKSFWREEFPSCVTPLSQATRPPFAWAREGPGVLGALLGTLLSWAIRGPAQRQRLREARKLCIAFDHNQLWLSRYPNKCCKQRKYCHEIFVVFSHCV